MSLTVKKRRRKQKLQTSAIVKVFDIPMGDILGSAENPQEMNDVTFDQLVEGIRTEGFDEPCMVMPLYDDAGKRSGKYTMVSGHHRMKAAKVVGMERLPCVIRTDMDEDGRKIALIRRNMLRGSLNPEKFTKLFNELSKKYDKELLKLQMGFTKKDGFDKVYKSVEKTLTKIQKKKLAEAKETITSVDDLSSVLNTIFKEHGSELDYGFMVFSFGGKDHHYFETDAKLNGQVKKFEQYCIDSDITVQEAFSELFSSLGLKPAKKSASGKKKRKKVK